MTYMIVEIKISRTDLGLSGMMSYDAKCFIN